MFHRQMQLFGQKWQTAKNEQREIFMKLFSELLSSLIYNNFLLLFNQTWLVFLPGILAHTLTTHTCLKTYGSNYKHKHKTRQA